MERLIAATSALPVEIDEEIEVEKTEDETASEELKEIVNTAKERFDRVQKINASARQQAVADTKFYLGDSDNGWQWPDNVAQSRASASRVCLTVNITAQHINQIVNQMRQGRPACRILPVDDMSDKKTAEILSGLIRNIQSASNASDAHDIAAEHACVGGEGYWRIITEYESPESFNQVIRIKPCHNPMLVYIDPDSKELDKSDAQWGFVFEEVNREAFKREYPDIDPSNWINDNRHWVADDTVRLAEYFYCEFIDDSALLLGDGSSVLESKLDDGVKRDGMTLVREATGEIVRIVKERETQRKQWKWCKLVGGSDEPVDLKDWVGSYLPIICVVGKELNVNGELVRKGLVRDLKDPARMVNYSYSETVQTLALQNKVPYLASAEAIEGYENIWKSANVDNRAFLPHNAFTKKGTPIPAPQRQQAAVMPSAQVQLLQLSTEEMRGVSGQQNSNFGIKSEAASGVGIQRLKSQGELATFHFPDNLARGLKYEATLLIDLIQKIYDTKRVIRIIGLDGKHTQATLDPTHPVAYSEQYLNEGDIARIFNPTIGEYDVVIDTGPSFQTQRQEAFAAMTDLAGKAPNLMSLAGDIIMRAADFPMAEQLANRLEKALPPGLHEAEGGAEQKLAQATQQMQQMDAAMKEMQAKLTQAEAGIQNTQLQIQSKQQIIQAEISAKKELTQFEIESKQRIAEVEANLLVEKHSREAEAKHNQALIDADILRGNLRFEADILAEQAQQAAELKLQIAKLDNETKEDIAELNAYVELQKVGMQNAALTADVESDMSEENDTESPTEELPLVHPDTGHVLHVDANGNKAYVGQDGSVSEV